MTTERPYNASHHNISILKIAAAAAVLALSPAVLASSAAAETDAPARSGHHVRAHHAHAHFRHSYARAYGPAPVYVAPGYGDEWAPAYGYQGGYSCGIGLYNTPLPCVPNN